MATHHYPIIHIDDEDLDTFLDDADCAYCSDRITRNPGERWTNAAGETTCAVAPDMTENANGSRYCTDCGSIVILFDDDIHYCREAWRRVTNEGRVAPEDVVWTLYERDENEEVVRPTMGGDCVLVFAGEDDLRYYRCVVHDDIVIGTDVWCNASMEEV